MLIPLFHHHICWKCMYVSLITNQQFSLEECLRKTHFSVAISRKVSVVPVCGHLFSFYSNKFGIQSVTVINSTWVPHINWMRAALSIDLKFALYSIHCRDFWSIPICQYYLINKMMCVSISCFVFVYDLNIPKLFTKNLFNNPHIKKKPRGKCYSMLICWIILIYIAEMIGNQFKNQPDFC